MEHKIYGCQECPMYNDEYENKGFGLCCHPFVDNWVDKPYRYNSNRIEMGSSGEDLSFIQFPETSDWCPLNKEPITITKNK